jgi:acyl-ACP thioesterase
MTREKIDTFKYVVEPFDDDFTGRLSWNVLGKHILACAERHAGARGFDRLNEDGHRFLWVLSRMVFEMYEWPHLGDNYAISTWVRRYYRYFIDRYFDILNAEGRLIGRVFTIWAMINEKTRKPEALNELFGHTFDPYLETQRPCDMQPLSHIRMATESPISTRRAYYSDIDENNHVNSIRYIELILDSFPKELFSSHEVKRLEIAYNTESYCGDSLSFYSQPSAPDDYFVVIKKNVGDPQQPLGETICHSAVTFAPISKLTKQ